MAAQTRPRTLGIRISQEERDLWRAAAFADGMNLSTWIRYLIIQELRSRGVQ